MFKTRGPVMFLPQSEQVTDADEEVYIYLLIATDELTQVRSLFSIQSCKTVVLPTLLPIFTVSDMLTTAKTFWRSSLS